MNSHEKLRSCFRTHPIICSVRNSDDLSFVLQLGMPRCVFLLGTSLDAVPHTVSALLAKGHMPFVHVDLVEGLRPDAAGLRFLVAHAKPMGIISTHRSVVEKAADMGLMTILRVFILDSEALGKGRTLVSHLMPDFVELLPGVALMDMSERYFKDFRVSILAGGLIDTKEQVSTLLAKGVTGISTSSRSIW